VIALLTTARSRRRSLLAALLLLVVHAVATAACGDSDRYASVDGSGIAGRVVMVRDGTSAESRPSPLPGVRVQIADMKTAEYITEVKTDAVGRFAFGLAPGRYTIKAILPARQALVTPVIATVRRGKVTPVTVSVEPPLSSVSP
jgi:hypothetical protein